MAKRLTKDDWEAARQRWESDNSLSDSDIAAMLGVSKQAVSKRRTADNWQRVGALQNINQRAQFAADLKSCQLVVGDNKKAFEVVDAATEIRADVLERHRADWAEHRTHFKLGDIREDFDLGKSAKITAEMLKIRQEGERKAFGLDEQQSTDNKTSLADAITSLIDKLPN